MFHFYLPLFHLYILVTVSFLLVNVSFLLASVSFVYTCHCFICYFSLFHLLLGYVSVICLLLAVSLYLATQQSTENL